VKFLTARNSLIGTGKTDLAGIPIASKRIGNVDTHLNLVYTFVGQPAGASLSNTVGGAAAVMVPFGRRFRPYSEFLAATADCHQVFIAIFVVFLRALIGRGGGAMALISKGEAWCLFALIPLFVTGSGPMRADTAWMQSFKVDPGELATTGENRYFILRPGYRLTLEGKESGRAARLVITVLDETKNLGGVETRVVEERETSGGAPVEVSRNYFAISKRTGDVYYFGEDVDIYRHGKLAGHEGGWHHGSSNARYGLMMPGAPALGTRYYQEQAPGVAMDRAEIVSLTERAATPGGTFEGCLKTKETSPLEPLAKEFKLYAPGVGLIKDGSLELVSHVSLIQ
jgi:hypothetical protein